MRPECRNDVTRHALCFPDAACDGAGHHRRRCMAKHNALADRVIQLPGTGGCGKNQVTVKGGVAWHQRAGKAVMRGNG